MINKKNIIWDLSGTLFRPTAKNFSTEFAPSLSLLLYMWSGKKAMTQYDEIALEILYKTKNLKQSEEIARLHSGKPVPKIVCLLLSGLINNTNAYQEVMTQYHLYTKSISLSIKEKNLIHDMLYTFFDPEILALAMQPINSTKNILAQCYESMKYNLYVLSNWDLDSFNILYNSGHGQKVFKYFKKENIVISGQTGYLKPHPEIFRYFIEHTKIQPEESIFIDDQLENIREADSFGITALQFKNNINFIKETLKLNF